MALQGVVGPHHVFARWVEHGHRIGRGFQHSGQFVGPTGLVHFVGDVDHGQESTRTTGRIRSDGCGGQVDPAGGAVGGQEPEPASQRCAIVQRTSQIGQEVNSTVGVDVSGPAIA